MGSVFNLNKIAASYKTMDTNSLKKKISELSRVDIYSQEFSELLQELVRRSDKDRSLENFIEQITALYATKASDSEIAEYEQEQANFSQSIQNQGLDLLNKINLEAYKIINENINRITSLDKTLQEKCNLNFISRFMGKYNTETDAPEGCKSNIGKFFLDRFSNVELRKNVFNRYDFFGVNPSILRYYARNAYFSDPSYLRSINEDVHSHFMHHMNHAGLNGVGESDKDKIGAREFNDRLTSEQYDYATFSQTRGLPLLAKQVSLDEKGNSTFLIVKVLSHFYESLKNRDESSVCFVLDKFIQLVNYSVKTEEYGGDSGSICQARETGINFLSRSKFHLNNKAIDLIKQKVKEIESFQRGLERLGTNFSGDAQTYLLSISNGLSECIFNLSQWMDQVDKWQKFQEEMYANKDYSLNYLNIIINKHIMGRGNSSEGSLNTGEFAPIEYISSNGVVRLSCTFKVTGEMVQPVYEYSRNDKNEYEPQSKQLDKKKEINFNRLGMSLSDNLALKIPTESFSEIVNSPDRGVVELCEIVSSIPTLGTISPKNLKKDPGGYYAISEQQVVDFDGEKMIEIADQIKDFLSENFDQVIKISSYFKNSKMSLPPIPSFDGGSELSKKEEVKYPTQGFHSVDSLKKFFPHQGIVLHQILLAVENEYRNAIVESSKELGLTDEAFECYESLGKITIKSKIDELGKSLAQIESNDPRRASIEAYKNKLESLMAKMNIIFTGVKPDGKALPGLDSTGWTSSGTSHNKIRARPNQSNVYLYSFPDWLSQALSLDDNSYKSMIALGGDSKIDFIVPKEKRQEIIRSYLDGLEEHRVLDLGAMLKIVNNLSNPDSDPVCNVNVNKNYAGSEIGKAVKKAMDVRRISEQDAKSIALIFSSLSKGDGLAYLRAIGFSDIPDTEKNKSYGDMSSIKEVQASSQNKLEKTSSVKERFSTSCIDYSIHDWTKFIARRIYLGG